MEATTILDRWLVHPWKGDHCQRPVRAVYQRKRVLIAATIIALGFAVHAVLRGEESVEHQIGKQVYDESCHITVLTNEGVLRRWPGAAEAKLISCDTSENDPFPNHLMDYARYPSVAALSERLEAAAPDGRYCTLGSTVVVLDDLATEFAAMCAKRGGTFRG